MNYLRKVNCGVILCFSLGLCILMTLNIPTVWIDVLRLAALWISR